MLLAEGRREIQGLRLWKAQGIAVQFWNLLRSKEVCQVNQCICQGRLEATWDHKPKLSTGAG